MEQKLAIGLDNPMLSGRLKHPDTVKRVPERVSADKAKFMKKGASDIWMKKRGPLTMKRSPKRVARPSTVRYKTALVPGSRVVDHVEDKAAQIARQTFEQNVQSKKKSKFKKNRKLTNSILYALALMLFVTGSFVAIQTYLLNQQIEETYVAAEGSAPDDVVVANANAQQEEPDWGAYTVDPLMPRFLTIEKLNKKARIMHLGVDEKNAMLAPYNVHDAGWFNGSALPGKGSGAALLSGHVSGPTERGVFYELTKLVEGDEVTIERGDGKIFRYRVIGSETQEVEKLNMTKALKPQSDKPGLNMITCAGKYNHVAGEYDSRHVVYTEQIN